MSRFISAYYLLGVCNEADSGGPLSGEDREDPSLTELQRLRLSGEQVWVNISTEVGWLWTNRTVTLILSTGLKGPK